MDEWKRMINDCMERQSRMSDWEQGFVQSLSERLDAGRGLTDPQANRLEDIWERVTAAY